MNGEPSSWECVTCESRFEWAPVIHLGLAFCCDGCVAGGPCSCSYDESPDRSAGSDALVVAWRIAGPVPMTAEARRHLVAERASLQTALEQADAWRAYGVGERYQAPANPWPDGEIERRAERIRNIDRILERACVPSVDSGAAVGQRVVVETADGRLERFHLVPPGEGDATRHRVSPQSHLGATLVGCHEGETLWIAASPRKVLGRVVQID